jgi:hypothetical protein
MHYRRDVVGEGSSLRDVLVSLVSRHFRTG